MSEIVKFCDIHGDLTIEQVDKRSDGNSYRCKECRKSYMRVKCLEWRNRNLDKMKKINEKIREDRKNNPEKYREYERKKRLENIGQYRLADVLHKRKISKDLYERMIKDQNNLCKICGCEETRTGKTSDKVPLAVDHCHVCNHHVRGLLCRDCNTALGKVSDSIEILQSAIQYLKSHEHVEKIQ